MTDEQPNWSLAALDQRQAALYSALAQYQHAAAGEALVHPGSFGLAIYHQLEQHDGATYLRAVLAHKDGGSLDSGLARIDGGDLALFPEELTSFVLGVRAVAFSAPQQSQQDPKPVCPMPAPVEITDAQAPEPACPMPAPPAPAAEPEPVAPAPAVEPEQQPEPEEVEEVLSALDEINARTPDALKAILTAYKAAHPLGRTPFVKSLTTRARLATIRQLIAENQP
jgi:hypothetical protein